MSIANVGDINGDGIDDFAIGATGVGDTSQGAVYIVFGTTSGFAADVSLSTLNGTNRFQVNGGEYLQDFVGTSVAAAGDVNGDGIDDLIIGASGADPDGGGSGAAYVLFGKNTALDGEFDADIATSSLNGATGFQISGTTTLAGVGVSVGGGGDFNGDGIADLIVGGNQADGYRGAAYVIFGTASGFPGNIDVANLAGTNGFKIAAANAYDAVGTSVANAGDINGDGIDDLIVGARGVDSNGSNAGAAYIVFGKNTAVEGDFAATVTVDSLNGATGFRVAGLEANDRLGVSVDSAGDVNGDGIDDFIVGAYGLTNNGGAFVVFGRDTSVTGNFAASFSAGDLDGTNGFRIDGEAPNDGFGFRVAGMGDVNGDGFDDIGVGAYGQDPNGSGSGAVYIILGRGAFGATVSLATLDGSDGFQISGEAAGDQTRNVAGRGDFNNDGVADILVGAPFHNAGNADTGAAWIIYGISAQTLIGTPGNDDLTGTGVNDSGDGGLGQDILRGEDGDDFLSGGGDNDELYGGADNDILSGDDGADKLFGDAGADQLIGGAGGDLLDGGTGPDDMTGGTGDDTYVVDDVGDTVTELGGEGNDRVRASITYILGAELEHLQLTGSGDINGFGNALANQITGNSEANLLSGLAGNDILNGGGGNDTLIGGLGNDTLTGGAGFDRFVTLQESVFASSNPGLRTIETDTISDYVIGQDTLDLSSIDAISGTSGVNDAFGIVAAFNGTAGQMTVSFAGGITTVLLDVDGDAKADYRLRINGDVTAETGGWTL